MTKELNFKKTRPEIKWLNDEDIGNYFRSITTKYSVGKESISLFENAFILGNLVEWFNNGTPIGRSANGLIKRINKNRFVLIPACKQQNHWTLFVYDKSNQTFHHYNSYKNINNLQYFRPFLQSNKLEIDKSNFVEHQTPQQGNRDDCGVYVIAITELLVRRYQDSSSIMSWEINHEEAAEIKKNVLWFRKMLEEGKDYFTDLATETTQKKKRNLGKTRSIITQAQAIFDKNEATKEEIEKVINDLKTLSTATSDSVEAQVWVENKTVNEKLLMGLTEKLNKQNIANPPNSNNTVPQTETKPEGEKEKPNSGKDNINSDETSNDNNNKPKPTPSSSQPLEDKVQQDIQQEQEKTKNSLKNDINQAKNGTDEDKFNAIKNSGKVLGEKGFEEEKSELAIIEEQLAINNPSKHLEAIRAKIEENLKKNKLTIEELDDEIQADYLNIKEKGDNVDKIIENIGKTGVKKRIKKFKEEISKVAKFSKEKVQRLKEKLLKFIHSSNKYEQEYKKEAQNLLAQLEKVNQIQKPNSDFPISWVIGGGVLAMVGLTAFLVIRNKRKRKLVKVRKSSSNSP